MLTSSLLVAVRMAGPTEPLPCGSAVMVKGVNDCAAVLVAVSRRTALPSVPINGFGSKVAVTSGGKPSNESKSGPSEPLSRSTFTGTSRLPPCNSTRSPPPIRRETSGSRLSG